MLRKIDQLHHIGRFQKLQHRAEAFGTLALLFARNGCGKTTMCAVLRSAMAQNSRPLDERAHLGPGGALSATLEFDPAGTVSFNNGSWNKSPPPMLVFDADYVRSNVHTAEEVTRDNKRRLLQVIIGSSGVTLAEKIAALDAENDTINAAIRRAEGAIRRAVPIVTDVKAFVEAAIPGDLETRTAASARLVAASEQAAEIGRRPLLRSPTLGPNAGDYVELLKGHAKELSDGGTDRLEGHLAKHQMQDGGRRWLSYGVEHATTDDCPFCDQSLDGSRLFPTLRAVFSEGFQEIADAIDRARALVVDMAGDGPASLSATAAQNEALAASWSAVIELPRLPQIGDDDLKAAKGALDGMAAALKVKSANPVVPVVMPDDQAAQWRATVQLIEDYTSSVAEANEAIAALKSAEGRPTQSQAVEAKSTLSKYQALAQRETEPLKTECRDWAKGTARHEAIAKERLNAQQALRAHTEAMATEYQDGVNELLELFGVNFRLCQTKASFKGGGEPNTEYCIDINGHVLPVGEAKDRAPSFRTVLSSGDKASLALALFIAQAKRRADLADLVLVFDDPFNSQDAGRQFETSARLRELAKLARQVVVLSHDARFLHLIRKDAEPASCSEHHVVMTGDWTGTISAWSAADEVEADYVRRAQRIRNYAATGQHLQDCNPRLLADDLRVFMEEYLDQRFPGRFPSSTMLGGMVEAIHTAGKDDPLYPQCTALRELNEFSRPEHHRGTQKPDPTQLRAQCRKVVKIIGIY